VPPAANGTTRVICRVGQLSERADAVPATSAVAIAMIRTIRIGRLQLENSDQER
jgi:hypothetical protein